MAVGFGSVLVFIPQGLGVVPAVPPEVVSNAYRRMAASEVAGREVRRDPSDDVFFDPLLWEKKPSTDQDILMFLLMN